MFYTKVTTLKPNVDQKANNKIIIKNKRKMVKSKAAWSFHAAKRFSIFDAFGFRMDIMVTNDDIEDHRDDQYGQDQIMIYHCFLLCSHNNTEDMNKKMKSR